MRLVIVVPIALFLIFVVLYTMFNSVRPAVLIYLNIPLAATGGILALALRGMPFSTSAGAEVHQPLATVVIGGLVTSTALILLVLPPLYVWEERFRERWTRRRNKEFEATVQGTAP